LVGVPALRDPMGSGTPRATLGVGTGDGLWRKGTGNTKPPKQLGSKTSRGSKQKLKATSEEMNKRKQTLGLRKQKPTSD